MAYYKLIAIKLLQLSRCTLINQLIDKIERLNFNIPLYQLRKYLYLIFTDPIYENGVSKFFFGTTKNQAIITYLIKKIFPRNLPKKR